MHPGKVMIDQELGGDKLPPIEENNILGLSSKLQKIVAQVALVRLDLSIISSVREHFPSKHLQFCSFQMTQMFAKKEDRHRSRPLEDPNPNFHATKRSTIVLGRTQCIFLFFLCLLAILLDGGLRPIFFILFCLLFGTFILYYSAFWCKLSLKIYIYLGPNFMVNE